MLDQWSLACIHCPGLAAFAENSKSVKTPTSTNFHCIAIKFLHIKWNALPLKMLAVPMVSCIHP